jgi:hypothetical protein
MAILAKAREIRSFRASVEGTAPGPRAQKAESSSYSYRGRIITLKTAKGRIEN